MALASAPGAVVMGDLLDRPVDRWRRGAEVVRAERLPTPASIRRTAGDGAAQPADAAVLYLEALVSAGLEATAGEIDAETAGRCLLAEDVLYILTGSSDLDRVRGWLRARGLQRLEHGC